MLHAKPVHGNQDFKKKNSITFEVWMNAFLKHFLAYLNMQYLE